MSEATKAKEMDMLNGKLAGKLILFAIPLAFSSILQQLFNSADVAVVGRFAGSNALAAVGSCVALVGIFVNLIVGLAVRPNAALANLIGQNKRSSRIRKISPIRIPKRINIHFIISHNICSIGSPVFQIFFYFKISSFGINLFDHILYHLYSTGFSSSHSNDQRTGGSGASLYKHACRKNFQNISGIIRQSNNVDIRHEFASSDPGSYSSRIFYIISYVIVFHPFQQSALTSVIMPNRAA